MKRLTEGNLYKTFILFALPLVLSGVLSQAYNLLDTVIAGQYLGEEGLAAIGATSSFITFLSSVFWGFASGFCIYIARLFGAGENEKIRSALLAESALVFFCALAVGVASVLFRGTIFDFLCVAPEIREATAAYFDVYILGLCLIVLNTNLVLFLHALGSSGFPFVMSILSAVLNIGGNILSVAVLGLGTRGIAAASVLAAGVTDVCMLFYVRRCFRELGVVGRSLSVARGCIRESFAYAVPVMLQQMIMYLAGMVVAPAVNGLGVSVTAGYAVAMNVNEANASVYQNSSKTLANYTAQCIGAGEPERIRRGVRVAYLQAHIFLFPVLLACVLWPESICSLFFRKADGEALALAARFASVFLPFVLFNLVNNLFHSLYRGVKAMRLLMLSTAIGSVARIAATYALVGTLGADGVYLGLVIAWATEALFSILVYFSGRWQPPDLKEKTKTGKAL